MMHGFGGSSKDYVNFTKHIQKYHPGTPMYAIHGYEDTASEVHNLWKQLDRMLDEMRQVIKENNYTEYHLVGHSQGALLSRSAAQFMDDHNIVNLVLLAGPQNGIYGVPGGSMAKYFGNHSREDAYIVFYNALAQDTLAAANMWHDPTRESEFLKVNTFVPIVSGEMADNATRTRMRDNFLRVRDNVVLVCGPDDGTIIPWQSAHFGFYNASLGIVAAEDTVAYRDDLTGLQTLATDGRLIFEQMSGVEHEGWIDREDVFVELLEQYLW